MALRAFSRSMQKRAPDLLLQIFVLVTGITLSFALNEWRVHRGDRALERHLLTNIHADLAVDSTALARYVGLLGEMASAYEAFLDPALVQTHSTDSLDHYADLLLTYAVFNPQDDTYEGMQQTGSSRLISDPVLLSDIVGLYNTGYYNAREWSDINRQFVLEHVIPYVDAHAPYTKLEVTGIQWRGLHESFVPLIGQDHFRNLVRTNRLYKLSQRAIFEMTLVRVRAVMAKIEAGLAA